MSCMDFISPARTLGYLKIATSQPCVAKEPKAISQNEENTMNVTTNSFQSERTTLRDLAYDLQREKARELRKIYHLDAYQPITIGEVKQLLKDGKVTVHPDFDKEDRLEDESMLEYRCATNVLVFNYQKPDKISYNKAAKKLDLESKKLLSQIAILPPEEALKKLEAFESKTIH